MAFVGRRLQLWVLVIAVEQLELYWQAAHGSSRGYGSRDGGGASSYSEGSKANQADGNLCSRNGIYASQRMAKLRLRRQWNQC